MTWTRTVFVPAYAKVNLTLEVLGRRDDGFHDLASVMQTIALHDTLALRPTGDGEFGLECDAEDLATPTNLALRAAHAVARACGVSQGVHVELRKQIPVQAGLGGGSSDAAALLLALPRLWGRVLPLHHLARIAAELGSDVPFFLAAGTAIVSGRGERVASLPDMRAQWMVLARPPVAVPTGRAFAALTADDYADGSHSAELARALTSGEPLLGERMVNSFARSVQRDYPPLATLWHAFRSAGASSVHLSGSGPTLYALFEHLTSAAGVWRHLRDNGHEVWLTHTVSREFALAAANPQPDDRSDMHLRA